MSLGRWGMSRVFILSMIGALFLVVWLALYCVYLSCVLGLLDFVMRIELVDSELFYYFFRRFLLSLYLGSRSIASTSSKTCRYVL